MMKAIRISHHRTLQGNQEAAFLSSPTQGTVQSCKETEVRLDLMLWNILTNYLFSLIRKHKPFP